MALHPSPRSPRVEPDPERAVTPLPARRILIIGNGGAGKSTLAAALGAHTDLPVIHLDRLYWRAGWEQTPRSEWVETLQQLMAPDAWILDGNYRGTLTERVERADALVLLDPLTPVCLWRIVRRRFVARQTADLAEGCDERLDIEFVRYVAGYRRTHRRMPLPRAPQPRVPASEFCTSAAALIPSRSPSLLATTAVWSERKRDVIEAQTEGNRS